MREYRRLLYVALTRAADELYVTGWMGQNHKKIPEGCWYDYVAKAMEKTGQEQEDGSWILADNTYSDVAIAQTKPHTPHLTPQTSLPPWLNQPMPEEPVPPRPLMPSKPKLAEPSQDSPLGGGDAKRGTLIHRLLEILPDIAPEHRQASAELLLKKHQITEAESAQWISETLQILDDQRFAAVFGKGSLAEVPVTALLADNQIISGQIDRLVVLEDSVLIVDYKTSFHIPSSQDKVPEYFRAQLTSYAQSIAPIYPNKRIEVAILWTHAPKLMPLVIET